MKAKQRLLALLLAVLMLAGMVGNAVAADEAYASTYTYNYDYWSDIRESPDAYRVQKVIYSSDLGLDVAMKKPQSLFVQGNDLYVVDTGNNRILQIARNGDQYTLTRIIDTVNGAQVPNFNNPNDVNVDKDGNIYVADTNNQRVVMMDKDLNFIKQFVKPANATFTITGPNGFSKTVSFSEFNRDEYVLEGLTVGEYTVTEDEGSAMAPGYLMEVVGNNATVTVTKDATVEVLIENHYTEGFAGGIAPVVQPEEAVADEAATGDEAAAEETATEEAAAEEAPAEETAPAEPVILIDPNFVGDSIPGHVEFTVTGPDGFEKVITYAEFNEGIYELKDLPEGEYTVVQNEEMAAVTGYDLVVTGNNKTVKVEEGKSLSLRMVNDYQVHTGTLKIRAKGIGADIPVNSTFDQTLSFLPNKLVVDVSGRVFTLATNVNKGVVKFENTTEFTGYVGANKVSYSLYDYIWKTWFSTKEQRAQQAAFVPTEYCNLYMDEDSFIYATNVVFSEYDLLYDVAQPIRRLNGVGNDILIKNDRYPPIGDLYWVEQNNHYGPSKFHDITVLENDIYVGMDRTRGRLFGYDSQGIMLWAFGTSGSSEGAFTTAVSMEHMGRDLFVLDEAECSITVFVPTEYGNLIYEASDAYIKGDYDGSAQLWQEVLKYNANYNLAFIGIGRALMRNEQFDEAMDYFKMAMDRDNYGRAFRLFRKIWVEEKFTWLSNNTVWVILAVIVILIPVVRKMIKKRKMEVEAYERNQVAK